MNHNKTGGGSIGSQELIFLVLLPASLFDLYQYRVPNAIIGIGLVLSLYDNIWQYGILGIGSFSLKCLFPFVVCFIFYLFHVLGAGDIKIFSIICSYFNVEYCVRIMAVSLLIGALLSLFKMILQKSFIRRFRHFSMYVRNLMSGGPIRAYYDLKTCGDEGVIPFTICITLAVIICTTGR